MPQPYAIVYSGQPFGQVDKKEVDTQRLRINELEVEIEELRAEKGTEVDDLRQKIDEMQKSLETISKAVIERREWEKRSKQLPEDKNR